MAVDFKKTLKHLYTPKTKPSIVNVDKANYIAVRGAGDPNDENSEYKKSISLLYPVAYAIKMSKKGDYEIPNYFDFVVPPLEGFWWQDGIEGVDYANKQNFKFISLIRMPDFVTKEVFDWAIEQVTEKKKEDFSSVEYFTYDEGQCVQCMHIGPYDSELETVAKMHEYMISEDYELDINESRYHHEIYISDVRKTVPEKLKTVIRHPIKKKS